MNRRTAASTRSEVPLRQSTSSCAKRGVLASFGVCLCLAACAGYRGGWESVPYIGDPPRALQEYRTPFEAHQRAEIELPGLNLGVGINNRTRTYDTQVYLYALPLSIDPRNVQVEAVESGKTRITLRISKTDGAWVFRPRAAKLIVSGQAVKATEGYEFGMWDALGQRVAHGGNWAHRPVGDSLTLSDSARTYLLSIEFSLLAPSPQEAGIALDLSEALRATGQPAIPLIRFHPMRWREGYT